MNSSVWAVWAVRTVREKSGFEEFEQLLSEFEGGFFNFWWSKQTFKKISALKSCIK